jgi:hypothetical protein
VAETCDYIRQWWLRTLVDRQPEGRREGMSRLRWLKDAERDLWDCKRSD